MLDTCTDPVELPTFDPGESSDTVLYVSDGLFDVHTACRDE
jgi:hypothetical protein